VPAAILGPTPGVVLPLGAFQLTVMEVKLDNPNHLSSVASIVASYFEKEDHIDVTFVCAGGRKVKGHKLILSVVSPFLKKMFSECGGNQDMITVLLPDINGNVLKVFLDFVYEGTVKLSKTELEEFKVIQDMLEIRFPGVILNEWLIQHPPRTRPPPLVKLDNRNHSGHQTTSLPHNRSVGERQETEATAINSDNHVNAREPSSSVNDSFPPRRHSEDPDNDPLNIPDFYFLPTDSSKYEKKSISSEIVYWLVSNALTHWPCTHIKIKQVLPLVAYSKSFIKWNRHCKIWYWIHLLTLVTN